MSRVIGVTLLFIILVDNFCDSTALRAQFKVSKVHLLKCMCRDFPKGEIKCRSSVFLTKHVKKQDLFKCFCNNAYKHKFPEIQAACTSWRSGIPITLA